MQVAIVVIRRVMKEKIEVLEKQISNLTRKLDLIGSIQMLIVSELGDTNNEFQNKFIATCLGKDDVRNGFTDFVFKTGTDAQKSAVQELNLKIQEIKERYDNE